MVPLGKVGGREDGERGGKEKGEREGGREGGGEQGRGEGRRGERREGDHNNNHYLFLEFVFIHPNPWCARLPGCQAGGCPLLIDAIIKQCNTMILLCQRDAVLVY